MPNRDPIPTPNADTPRGPTPTPGIPDRIQEKPPLTPAQDPRHEESSGPAAGPGTAADRGSGWGGVILFLGFGGCPSP